MMTKQFLVIVFDRGWFLDFFHMYLTFLCMRPCYFPLKIFIRRNLSTIQKLMRQVGLPFIIIFVVSWSGSLGRLCRSHCSKMNQVVGSCVLWESCTFSTCRERCGTFFKPEKCFNDIFSSTKAVIRDCLVIAVQSISKL